MQGPRKRGFLSDLATAPWADRVQLHLSSEGTRVDLNDLLSNYKTGWALYTCGPDRYMNAVLDTASEYGWPEEAVRREYFQSPEVPEYENHDFTLKLAKSGKEIPVLADQSATDALTAAGVHINVKCSDGICGVCQCSVLNG